jgi:hypothetical protein
VVGLDEGSISSYNAVMWAILVMVTIALLSGSYILKTKNKLLAAKWLLSVMVIPIFLYFLYFLFIIIANPSWQ